ncbi:CDP-glycerol glycerophosphotransferase family protein [Aeromicrobium duanguangcaii]|uniref:CDP-glycerol glycerophosphotransferase family protein n=1 Tax=Aeromicrobium duanguangcaii TaxID=2968086 RepID=A0ABY5KH64_9ACTN|nr:CDP-glycerol glycerophosphotransferase family protein [Aeromicrobium duanguangcaii]MCD9153742.1 CDP-glycerol glycerophosphotransferase family protein [Aeromicrobium duanguangcaii]UUI69180.1 CDP-glycerol glycerophosphotransferase family protein [Aeromicrobium duanguangcaii]
MTDQLPSLAARLRARRDREVDDLRHRFRTDLGTRNRVFAWSCAGLVLVAALVLTVRAVVHGLGPGAVLAAVLGVVLVRAAMLRPATPPHVHGLPGVPEPEVCPTPDPPDRGPFVLAVRWLGAVLAFAVALASLPVVLVVLVVLAIAAAPVVADKVRLWSARRTLRRALLAYEPRFVLGYGGYGGGPIHVGMWEPHLLASGDRGVIVGLRSHYCAELRAGIRPTMAWIAAGSDVLGDMRVLTVPSMTTFFYVHNAPGHLKLMGIRSVRHVWLGHGDSDKSGSHHSRHRRYDVLVASGEAAIDRYARHGVEIPRERFVLLGRPQSGEVLPAAVPVTEVERPTVLYAPTWTGNGKMTNFSSIKVADRILRALIDADVNIIFRPHPVFLRAPSWTDRLAALDAILQADHDDPTNDRQHLWGEEAVRGLSVADCMNRADALVSDVSSVVSDWLASGKPYLMVSMAHGLDEFAEAVPVAAGGYTVDRRLAGLPDVLDDMLHRDPLADRRRRLKVRVLGEYEGDESARAFAAWVHEMAHTPLVRS